MLFVPFVVRNLPSVRVLSSKSRVPSILSPARLRSLKNAEIAKESITYLVCLIMHDPT